MSSSPKSPLPGVLPIPAICPAFSYKRRRFVSIYEYLLAPMMSLIAQKKSRSAQQDLANFVYMMKMFSVVDFINVKESVLVICRELEDGLKKEIPILNDDESSEQDVSP